MLDQKDDSGKGLSVFGKALSNYGPSGMPKHSDPLDSIVATKQTLNLVEAANNKKGEQRIKTLAKAGSHAKRHGVAQYVMALLTQQLIAKAGSPQYIAFLEEAHDDGIEEDSVAMISRIATWLQPWGSLVSATASINEDYGTRLPWATKADFEFHKASSISVSNGTITGGTSIPYVTGPRLYTEIQSRMRQFKDVSYSWTSPTATDTDVRADFDASFLLVWMSPNLTIDGTSQVQFTDATGVVFTITSEDRTNNTYAIIMNSEIVQKVNSMTHSVNPGPPVEIASSLNTGIADAKEVHMWLANTVASFTGYLSANTRFLWIPVGDPVGNKLLLQVGLGHLEPKTAAGAMLEYMSDLLQNG